MFNVEKLEDNIYYYTDIYEHPENLFLKIKDVAVWEEWTASNSDTVYGSTYGKNYPIQKEILDIIKKSIQDCLGHYC